MPRTVKIVLASIWGLATLLLTSVQVVPILLAGKVGTQYGLELGSLGVIGAILYTLFALLVSAFVVAIFMFVIGAFIGSFAGLFLGRVKI